MNKVYTYGPYAVVIRPSGKITASRYEKMPSMEPNARIGVTKANGDFVVYVYAQDAQQAAKIAAGRRRELLRG